MEEIEQLEKQLTEATENLTKLGQKLKKSAAAEADFHSDYEEKKNGYLIELYSSEVDKATKRTVDQRTAMYRLKFATERRRWLLAKADYESDRDLFRGLQTKITSLQTLIGMEKAKMALV